jgi:hypothetical protein
VAEEENIYLENERGASLLAFRRNREDLVRFYRALGQFSNKSIPPQMRKEEASSKVIEGMEALLSENIRAFAEVEPQPEGRGLDAPVARLSLSMFLLDRLKKLQGLVLAGDSLSMLSLFISLRNRIAEELTSEYYAKSIEDITGDYLDIEPLLVACSELCGLAVPPLQEIVNEYALRLAEEVRRSA